MLPAMTFLRASELTASAVLGHQYFTASLLSRAKRSTPSMSDIIISAALPTARSRSAFIAAKV